jgi:hypothetical protein
MRIGTRIFRAPPPRWPGVYTSHARRDRFASISDLFIMAR